MKKAFVFKVDDHKIIATVWLDGEQIETKQFRAQREAIEWLEEDHFDIQAIRIQCSVITLNHQWPGWSD